MFLLLNSESSLFQDETEYASGCLFQDVFEGDFIDEVKDKELEMLI